MISVFPARLRVGTIFGFLAAMPILSIPQVNVWLEERVIGVAEDPVAPTTDTGDIGMPNDSEATSATARTKAVASATDERWAAERLAASTTAPATADSPYDATLRRLEALGAGYWRLETAVSPESGFQFECHLPVPDAGNYQRIFRSVAAEPLIAMRQVVEEVEAWRAAQTAGLTHGERR